jgi:hypothetical protein
LASILVVLATVAAHAAGHGYSNRQLGFAFNYPKSWRIASTTVGGVKQVTAYSSNSVESLTADLYPFRAGASLSRTLRSYVAYSKRLNGPSVTHYHWVKTTFAHKPAEGTILYPATEGGVPLASGLYVLGAGRRVYSIEIQTRGQHLPKTLGRFPSVYRLIIASWRFL